MLPQFSIGEGETDLAGSESIRFPFFLHRPMTLYVPTADMTPASYSYHVGMRLLGNILWLILGGLCLAVGWAVIGLVLCVTIVGIPLGVQAFKMAGLTLTPFGKTVVYGGGVGSMLLNIVWLILAGVWMAIGYVFAGLLNCVTIIGVPFGIQSFKMAKLALWPFGSQIYAVR